MLSSLLFIGFTLLYVGKFFMKKQKLHISKKRKVFSKDRQWNETQQTYLRQVIKKIIFT